MSRIRTIKPELFKHEELFDAEQETGLPLRLAFIGLWTQCDREGRFVWRPRQLKADIFPYDEVDFSRVLDALATRGFIVQYGCADRLFGHVPSWRRHQFINAKETASILPQPPETVSIFNPSVTREPRDAHDGKPQIGKEGKDIPLSETSSDVKPKSRRRIEYTPQFEAIWLEYPTDPNMSKADAFDAYRKLDAADQDAFAASIRPFRDYCRAHPDYRPKHMVGFIKSRRFDGFQPSKPATPDAIESRWTARLNIARQRHSWSTAEWGPAPGKPGCIVPEHLLQPDDGAGWQEWKQEAA